MRLTIALAACATLALAACDAPNDADGASPSDQAAVDGGTGATVEPGDDASPTPSPDPTPTATETGGGASIPVTVRGRWGLVPGDCTSTRGDAKGLIEVSAQQIEFYESVANLATVKERDSESIRAVFAFTGEGMTWSRDMELTVQNGGDSLVRTEYGDDAMEEPRTYTKCG